jgi:hypothetical protein
MSATNNAKLDAVVSKMKAQATGASASPTTPLPPPPLVGHGTPIIPASIGGRGAAAVARDTNAVTRDTNDTLMRAIQMTERTNDLGGSALNSLGKQSDLIRHSITTVEETHGNLRDSRRSLREMRLEYWKDRLGKALIILCLLLIIAFIVYEKWIKRFRS